MRRQLFSFFVSFCLGACLLLPSFGAGAEDLPIRKAGLWEMKMVGGSFNIVWRGQPDVDKPRIPAVPELIVQHCTDETTDKEMGTAFSPMSKEACSKQDVQKTAAGYVSDSVCSIAGRSITSHAEITGDFNSAYVVKTTSHSDAGPAGALRDTTMTIEAKWLGACKPDQKPGDIMMPGGMKMNVKDMEKLKGMVPTK